MGKEKRALKRGTYLLFVARSSIGGGPGNLNFFDVFEFVGRL